MCHAHVCVCSSFYDCAVEILLWTINLHKIIFQNPKPQIISFFNTCGKFSAVSISLNRLLIMYHQGISLPLMLFKRQELGAHPMQESSIGALLLLSATCSWMHSAYLKLHIKFPFDYAVTVHLIRVDFSADCRHASNLWMGCGHLAPQNNSCIALISKFPSIISGFWMGPDAEDGWGFVEAFVDHGFWLNMSQLLVSDHKLYMVHHHVLNHNVSNSSKRTWDSVILFLQVPWRSDKIMLSAICWTLD